MENLITTVNALQEVISLAKVQVPIELPRLIVVGSQSSGKSSVLESIVGKDFLPRGTGIVTRCPLILSLIKTDTETDYAKFGHVPGCEFTDFSEVCKEIETISREISKVSGVSTDEIYLSIYSKKVVDLTLIDLPGIIKNPLKGQARDIDKKINTMIYEYARQSNSIILAISPANNDLANSDALKVAREVDPDGNRTIGIITKIDIMDRGTNALEMLEGRQYKLKLGYIGVVCRSQEDIMNKIPLSHHLEKEAEFFNTHPVYREHSSRLGIDYLCRRLSQIFKQHITTTIPKLKSEVETLLASTDKELRELGGSIGTQAEKNEMIYRVISGYSKGFEDFIDGKELDNCFKELTGGSLILYIFKSFYYESILPIEPLREVTDYQIRIAISNATGVKGALFVSEIAFENLVIDIIKKLEGICLDMLYRVRDELYKISNVIKIQEFNRFPYLRDSLVNIAAEVIDESIPNSENNVKAIIQCESSFLNISHPDFIKSDEALLCAKSQIEDLAKKPKSKPQPEKRESFWFLGRKEEKKPFEEIGQNQQTDEFFDAEMTEKELEQIILIKILIESYFSIVKSNIADSVPKSIMRNLIIRTRQNLPKVLTNKLHGNQEVLDNLFEEHPEATSRRIYLKDLRTCLIKSSELLDKINI